MARRSMQGCGSLCPLLASAVFDSFEVIDFSWPLLCAGVDGVAQAHLRIDAAVEAVVPDRLWHQQDRDADQAQRA